MPFAMAAAVLYLTASLLQEATMKRVVVGTNDAADL
jgi:hypothetical protein